MATRRHRKSTKNPKGFRRNSKRKTRSNRKRGGAPNNKKEQLYEGLKKLKEDNIIGTTEQTDINEMFYKYSIEGDTKRVLTLVLSGTINVNMQNDAGNTPIIVASDYGHSQIVKILLNNGADPNIENKNGWTAIDFAVGFLIEKGHTQKDMLETDLFQTLTKAGARPGSAFYHMYKKPTDTGAKIHTPTLPGIDDISGGRRKTRK